MSQNRSEQLDLEVLICTHDRRQLLERTLDTLSRCRLPENCRVGVLVVANACSDDTPAWLSEVVKNSKYPLPMRWMEDPEPGKSHALNFAIPRSPGNLIAFVDDDHRVDENYLVALWEGTRRFPEADLFCGKILPDWTGKEPAWAHDAGEYRIYPLPVPSFELGEKAKLIEPGTATPGGGNLAIRKGLFEKVGPFLLELGPQGHNLGGAEDIEWVRRALSFGAKLYYLPGMVQYHYVDPQRMTLGYVLRKAFERSASTARLADGMEGFFGIPPFMLRKTLGYLGNSLLSLRQDRRRFYLTRLAASLGEIKGARQRYLHRQERD